jgi:enoyl-CoA hydratase
LTVRLEREGTTAWIRWSRPERLNAWDRASLAAIGEALEEAGAGDARAIVCFGEGGAWSAGDDLRETATLTPKEWAKAIDAFNNLTRAAVAAPQPVLAAIDGVCVGGAFEFAFACDVRLASPRSRFGCPEVAIGLSISNGFSLLAPRAARRLVLTGELVTGQEAYRLGLVDLLADDVEADARTLAERIGGLAPLAVAGSKRLLDEGGREALERALEGEAALCTELFETADAHEGLAAFLEKREAHFRGA